MNDFGETIDLNKTFETSMAIDVGHHPFASMEENPDYRKTKVLQGIPAAEVRKAEARRRLALLHSTLELTHQLFFPSNTDADMCFFFSHFLPVMFL